MAARKKSNKKSRKTKDRLTNQIKCLKNVARILAILLITDGFIRLFFSSSMYYVFPGIYLNTDLFFHLRWFGIGLFELILALGILKYRLWALYGLLVLTIIRIYTITVFLPKGFITPISSNWITYLLKLATAALIIYLFFNRKKLKFS